MRHTSHWTKYLYTCVHDLDTCVVGYMCGWLHVWLATCVVGYMCGRLHVWLATCGLQAPHYRGVLYERLHWRLEWNGQIQVQDINSHPEPTTRH